MTDSTVQSTKSAISRAPRTTTLPKLRFHEDLLIAPREFANSVRLGEEADYRAMLARVCARAGDFTTTIPKPADIVACEEEFGQTLREKVEEVCGPDWAETGARS
jgi:hypothetical protein